MARAATAAVKRPPLPVTARGQRTRQRILDAAERVFGERGYHAAGIAEITQRAKVALGTFYLYFPDKHAVFEDLVRTLNHRIRQEIQMAIADIPDRVDQEVVGFETFFKFVERDRDLYLTMAQAQAVAPHLYQWHYETLGRGYVRRLREAQAKGQISPELDPVTTAYALMGIAESLGRRWILWDRRAPAPTTRRALRAMLEGALRPRKARQ